MISWADEDRRRNEGSSESASEADGSTRAAASRGDLLNPHDFGALSPARIAALGSGGLGGAGSVRDGAVGRESLLRARRDVAGLNVGWDKISLLAAPATDPDGPLEARMREGVSALLAQMPDDAPECRLAAGTGERSDGSQDEAEDDVPQQTEERDLSARVPEASGYQSKHRASGPAKDAGTGDRHRAPRHAAPSTNFFALMSRRIGRVMPAHRQAAEA